MTALATARKGREHLGNEEFLVCWSDGRVAGYFSVS
jgi:hypothetical protein